MERSDKSVKGKTTSLTSLGNHGQTKRSYLADAFIVGSNSTGKRSKLVRNSKDLVEKRIESGMYVKREAMLPIYRSGKYYDGIGVIFSFYEFTSAEAELLVKIYLQGSCETKHLRITSSMVKDSLEDKNLIGAATRKLLCQELTAR